MIIPSSSHLPVAAELPLESLAKNPNLSEAEKVGELSRQFEAVLLRQILQNARKTVVPSKFNADSAVSSVYQDLVTNQLADNISKSGTFGLAESLRQQLVRQLDSEPKAPVEQAGITGRDAS